MLLFLITWLIGIYVIEVVFGSRLGELNAELGFGSKCVEVTILSSKKFFAPLCPMLLPIAGLLFLFGNSLQGK